MCIRVSDRARVWVCVREIDSLHSAAHPSPNSSFRLGWLRTTGADATVRTGRRVAAGRTTELQRRIG